METIKIKQIRSHIGCPKDQKRTLNALGLRKINQIVEHKKLLSILGMVNKVKHLVVIIEETLEYDPSCFARPEKGDKLIKEPTNYDDMSIIGRNVKIVTTILPQSFYDISLDALKKVIESNNNSQKDFDIYPILFNFRHYLELVMKDTLNNYRLLYCEIPEEKPDHSLLKLWEQLKPCIAKTDDVDSEDCKSFETLIEELHLLDKGSTSFRYAYNIDHKTKRKEEYFPERIELSLTNLKNVMIKMYNFIEGINHLSYHYLDSIQDNYETP